MKKKTPAGRPESEGAASREDGRIRLNKYLALNGIASRRKADELITGGEVMVDGEIVYELGQRIDPAKQRVEVNSVILRPEGDRHRYFLLNKPAGVVCTNDPRETRPRAIDLITDRKKGRIYTVGRLDEETEGLVILTNDGEFANRISHPRYGVTKTYRVTSSGAINETILKKLRAGVRLSDFRAHFNHVRIIKRTERQSILLVTLSEGRNREIRRAFARLKLPVRDLRRVRIGDLTDRGLKVGHWRPMTRDEVQGLLANTRGERAGSGPGSTSIRPSVRRSGGARPIRRGRYGRTGATRR